MTQRPGTSAPATAPHIVILGAGFGGLYLALHLARQVRRGTLQARITLLDRHNYFLFTPLLHEVAAGLVEMRHVVHPVRRFLRNLPVTFHEWLVEDIDLAEQTVLTDHGAVPYDYLVLALGSTTNYFGNQHLARHVIPLKTLGDAFRLRNHLIAMFEAASATTDADERRQMLTFAVAGAGYTGIEVIAEVRDLIHRSLLRDYPTINPAEVRLLVIEGLPEMPVPSDRPLAERTKRLLERRGIEVHLHARIQDAGLGWLQLANGERIWTNTLIWTAGVSASPIVSALPVPADHLGRVRVLDTLQLLDYPQVLAIGDCASLPNSDGRPLPPTAQVASQQATALAANMPLLLAGQPMRPFVYHHQGELGSLGARTAVADIHGFRFFGFPAWWLWRTVYLGKLPRWEDRFRIAADWTLDLFFRGNTSQIEVGACPICPLRICPSCAHPTSDLSVSEGLTGD